MTTENPTSNDHRQALQQLLRTARAYPFTLVPHPTAAAAIEWALEQTQEPAPPPGGWSTSLPTPQTCIRAIDLASQEPGRATLRDSMRWALPILRRAANLIQGPNPTEATDPTDPTEAIAVLEAAKEAATLQEAGVEMPCKPQEAKRIRIALGWALSILQCRRDPPAPEARIEITTHEWIPALVALTKRELRFWREAGEVSGNVTRRAASRAIRGLEQIIKTIPANLIQ